MTASPCPSEEVVSSYVEGRTDLGVDVESHVDQCEACRQLVSALSLLLADPEDEPAKKIGRFEIIRLLGSGAMGVVYLAHDPTLKRDVALKLLKGETAADSQSGASRLLREAQAMAKLAHPNVIPVYEVGTVDSQIFLAMEVVDGESLTAWSARQERSWTELLAVFIEAGRGLAAAHERGVIHRDFKPDNVLVGRDGRVRVTDFGLAAGLWDGGWELPAAADGARGSEMALTQEGQLVGTPAYMSPEQFDSAGVTAASDQFSFCVALFESIYGRRPFVGSTLPELMAAVVEGTVTPPRELGSPPELLAVVMRGLSRSPEGRHVDMSALLSELGAILGAAHRERGVRPFVGLAAFNEGDADRFYGRDHEVRQALERLESNPLLAIVGASGSGKSSLVRAGLIPRLRDAGWSTACIRPGRGPFYGLAEVLDIVGGTFEPAVRQERAKAIAEKPGDFADHLRECFADRGGRVLLFVDQLEELFTLSESQDAQRGFLAALGSICRDTTQTLKVVISIRADLLDRLADHREFLAHAANGLMLLPAPDRNSLELAFTEPVRSMGYEFESQELVSQIVGELEGVGSLPLLQFYADRLWDQRDRQAKMISRSSYEALGPVGGTLARHADAVVASLPGESRRVAQIIFRRLVTSAGTRNIVRRPELEQLAVDGASVGPVLDALAAARLVVFSDGPLGATVELIHESLIAEWPTLQKWLAEDREDVVFIEDLRTAANQWNDRGRGDGLLWRGRAAEHAAFVASRLSAPLSALEREFLDGVRRLATRAARVRMMVVTTILLVLSVTVIVGSVGLLKIRRAEQSARDEAQAARRAEDTVSQQLEELRESNRKREAAELAAKSARSSEQLSRGELENAYTALERANAELEAALKDSREQSERATRAASEARAAGQRLEKLLVIERARVKQLQKQRKKREGDTL